MIQYEGGCQGVQYVFSSVVLLYELSSQILWNVLFNSLKICAFAQYVKSLKTGESRFTHDDVSR